MRDERMNEKHWASMIRFNNEELEDLRACRECGPHAYMAKRAAWRQAEV